MNEKVALVLLSLLLVVHARADSLGFKAIGGRVSLVKPEGFDPTLGLGLQSDLGEVIPKVVLWPSIEYWSKSISGSFGSGVDASAWQINADAKYIMPAETTLDLFVGGGVVFIFNNVTTHFESLPGSDLSGSNRKNTKIGLNLLGGLDYPLSETLAANALAVFTFSDGWVFRFSGGFMVKFPK